MELKIFNFVDEVVEHLENIETDLLICAKRIEECFEAVITNQNAGYLNISSRVKSASSLKEKILRNNYYKKYHKAPELIRNLSDLIGIRIECRFIEDEGKVFDILKENFYKTNEEELYYHPNYPSIALDLSGPQPQEQKNGFKIFRIDGVCYFKDKRYNFELQIKSLVNIFWGEIEHKIIYKNNNYMVWDSFFKDIMNSIKKNLSMIDKQLLILDNQFNKVNAIDPVVRKEQLEKALSKIIYEIFSTRMEKSIGFIVDFKNSCDTIMKYIFRSNNAENLQDYNHTLLQTFTRLNDISKNDIDFNSEIKFERPVEFEDEFCKILSQVVLENINKDFQWNLFFRILFEIEPGNNVEDFETFVMFTKDRFDTNPSFQVIEGIFTKEESHEFINDIMTEIAVSFKKIDDIAFIYDQTIDEINEAIRYLVNIIKTRRIDYNNWKSNKAIYLQIFHIKTLAIFDLSLSMEAAKAFLTAIRLSTAKIEIGFGVLEILHKLENQDTIKAKHFLKFFKQV